jgi:predicted dehydrogenase
MQQQQQSRTVSRRAFVSTAGAGLAGAGLAAALPREAAQAVARTAGAAGSATEGGIVAPPPAIGRPMPELERPLGDPPERRVGWAVVGLGDFALNQMLPRFARTQHCRLTAVVSGNRDKALAVARAYGVPERAAYSYDTFDRLRDDPTVDVVYIVLPNAMHAEYTVRAAAAGKHVLCEKPMAPSEAECRQMINACRKAGRKLGIAYRAPWEPHNAEAIRMIRAGEIGAVREIVADHGRPLEPKKPADEWRADPARAGGGSLYDIGIYSLDGARYLTGEEPFEMSATFRKPPGSPGMDGTTIGVEQGFAWTMRFPSCALAHCTSSYDHQNVKRIQVMGEKAVLDLDPATEYEGNRLLVKRKEGTDERKLGPSELQFIRELDEMAAAVRENREPRTNGEHGMQDVRLMQLLYESARSGRPASVAAAAK